MLPKTYGRLPEGKRLEKILLSPNYRNGAFQNQSPTITLAPDSGFVKVLLQFLRKPKSTKPRTPMPFVRTDLNLPDSEAPVIIWFGHSSYFIRMNGMNLLIDPVLSGHASPFSFMVKAFASAGHYTAEDIPDIDVLILTHDHYDHLDYDTIRRLKNRVKKICCPLGVGAHLEYWGIPAASVTELDWWDETSLPGDLKLIAAPARHFSGRGTKRAQSLWCSYILSSTQHRLYLGGDSGYDSHFRQIGEKYGPFDMAILEAGQYNTSWPHIHMMPEETVQAALDLRAKSLMPVHWGKFSLALHPWNEPVQRVVKEAARTGMPLAIPRPGEPVTPGNPLEADHWWEEPV